MLIRHRNQGFEHPLGSEITPQTQYLQRRDFLQTLAMGAAGATLAGWAGRDAWRRPIAAAAALKGQPSKLAGAMTVEAATAYKDATSYNNFYEFGLDKDDPHAMPHAQDPALDGAHRRPGAEAADPGHRQPAQARAHGRAHLPPALRGGLVHGHPLGRLLAVRAAQEVQPLGGAKYVEFVTLADKAQMPGLEAACWTGPIPKACGWTRPCTR
jgi:sulfoxide reductase catalytic subunit YedY